jgi:hypothetical protein
MWVKLLNNVVASIDLKLPILKLKSNFQTNDVSFILGHVMGAFKL